MKRRTFIRAAAMTAAVTAAPALAAKRSGVAVGVGDYGSVWGEVTVDGVKADYVTFADENAGMIREFYLNEQGRFATYPNGRPMERVRYGDVRLSWPDHPEIERQVRGL